MKKAHNRAGALGTLGLFLTMGLLAAAAAQAQVTANDDMYQVNQGGTLNEAPPGVLINDGDPDRSILTATLISGPAHATSFNLNTDGSFTYTHDGTTTSTDSFVYEASNGTSTDTATVTIDISIVQAGPEAGSDTYGVAQSGTLTVNAPGVLANDTGEGTLTAILVDPPSHHVGTFSLNTDGSFTYTQDGSSAPTDTFTYQAFDGVLNSNLATVSIALDISGLPVSFSVEFTSLKSMHHRSQVGGGNSAVVKMEFLTDETEPALVQGTGTTFPPSTLQLVVASEGQTSADIEKQLESCEKLALVAQARPDKYNFEVVLSLADTGQLQGAGVDSISVLLTDGALMCSLERVQNIL